MTKQLSLLVLFLSLFSCAEKDKDSCKNHKLNGNIKYVEARTFNAVEKFGEIFKDGDTIKMIHSISFNRRGQVEKEKKKSKTEKTGLRLNFNYLNKYDNNGIIQECIDYNEKGDIAKEKRTYRYDTKGKLIEEKTVDGDGKLKKIEKMEYANEGKILTISIYNGNNRLLGKLKETYSSLNLLEKSNFYTTNGDPSIYRSYEYDKKGNQTLSSQIYYILEGFSLTTKSYYDKNDLLVSSEHITDDKIEEKITYKYNYEFDKKGNWIKKISYKNGKLYEITEREIEYYD